MSKEFECCFCGQKETFDEEQDIKDLEKFSSFICIDCYMKMLYAVKEGQCDTMVRHRYQKIEKEERRMIWIAQEITDMTETAIGEVIGVFDDKQKARSYSRRRSDERQVITSVTGWKINEELPMEFGGIRK